MKEKYISIILGFMCFLLTIGIFVQIKTVNQNSIKLGTNRAENELRDSVLKWKEKYDLAYEQLETKESKLDKLREKASNTSVTSEKVIKELDNNNASLGLTELIGEGITITLKDGIGTGGSKLDLSSYLVHYSDLIEVINSLKNAGAEAISVNGQRITNYTAISCVGNVIKINNEKIGVPFVINAIGSPEKLYGALTMLGGYIDKLRDEGVSVTVEKQTSIIIPKYTGIYKFEYADKIE
ncbi:MAG: DUF881 domain-containing protein [Clostridia bacterium]|nr:DUF881 domain-containing protein [Clostridia bacterium]